MGKPEPKELDDESIMTFGKQHKGKMLIDVPAKYLLWLWNEFEARGANGQRAKDVQAYIKENMDALIDEAKMK